MKKNTRLCLWMVFITAVAASGHAQTSKFNAGIIAGLNFAELEGEELMDYYGLNAGIIGTVGVSKHAQLGMELLFSQNGEYILPEFYPQLDYGKIRLNHLEIPIHIDWLIKVFQRDKFYDWNLNLGVAFTRLLGYKAEEMGGFDVTDQVVYGNKTASLLQAGTTYHFSDKIGLNLKASIPIRVEGLNWTVSARMVCMVF